VPLLDSALVRRVRRSPALRPPAIAAYRALDRMRPAPPGPRVIANSMPKSGTHLLAGLLDQLDGMRSAGRFVAFYEADRDTPEARFKILDKTLRGLRDSHYIGGHLIHDDRVEQKIKDSGVSLVTILRDPRAVVASGFHYVRDTPHMKMREQALELFPDEDAMWHGLVFGIGEPGDVFYQPEIGARYRAFVDWVDSKVAHTVRFEDLIGDQGGGSDDRQLKTVLGILDHLGHSPESADEIARRLFSEKSATFRSGSVDSWRKDLPDGLADEIAERCADSMDRLGYQR